MSTVIFNRETLKCTGVDRDVYPYEIIVSNVNVENVTKQYPYTVKVEKSNESGEPLYLLPQEDLVELIPKVRYEEDTEESELPVMITKVVKVPLLDEQGKQVRYEITERGETTEESDEPVMIEEVIDEETGETTLVQKTTNEGEPLFWGLVGTGQYRDCFTTEEQEIHKTTETGKKLYLHPIDESETINVPQEPLEITESHEDFEDYLPRALEDKTMYRTVKFEEEPELFEYEDFLILKREQVLKGTFFSEAILIERMDDELFSTSLSTFSGDLGYDFVSIPAEGEVRTIKLSLPKASDVVHVVTETSAEGLEILVGDTVDNIKLVNSKNEMDFLAPVSDVYVLFKNPTAKRIDLHSFALLV